MAAAELTHAEQARLAHQALRLRENGIDTQQKVARIAAPSKDGEVRLGGSGHPLAGVALAVANTMDADRPGPTDPKAVDSLMSIRTLDDIWRVWDAAVTANLESTLPAGELKAWRESVARDEKQFAEKVARMEDSGDEWAVHPYFGHMRHTDGAANSLYDEAREGFLISQIHMTTATIKIVLVDSADYTVNLATHEFLSSVAGAGRVATSGALTTKTTAAGVFDADDVVLATVTGDPSEAIVIYQSSAVGGGADVADTAQRLIGYIDTATGLPVTPNGGNITVAWDSGSNRIFKL